jgi:hypothetical protein
VQGVDGIELSLRLTATAILIADGVLAVIRQPIRNRGGTLGLPSESQTAAPNRAHLTLKCDRARQLATLTRHLASGNADSEPAVAAFVAVAIIALAGMGMTARLVRRPGQQREQSQRGARSEMNG